jgi:rhodanese-related sulfurtransferase
MSPHPPEIHPQTTLQRGLDIFPGAQRALFRRYHIGGCSSCAFQPGETLEALCRRNEGLDVEEVIAHLNRSREEDEAMLMEPAEVDRLLKSGTKLKLLDIRTREEFEAVRIEGAERMSQDTMRDILGTWAPGDLLVIYDHQGKQALDAAAYFQGQGLRNVKCIRGGIDAWSRLVDLKLPRYELA